MSDFMVDNRRKKVALSRRIIRIVDIIRRDDYFRVMTMGIRLLLLLVAFKFLGG